MISIIITAYKEQKTIGKAIKSIISQKLPKYELIVSAPDDETLNVAKKFQKTHKQIHIIRDAGKGKPAALNLIFKEAKGEILILTDGDVFVGKNSIKLLLEPFKNKKVGAVTGHSISLNSRKTLLGFWSHLLADYVGDIVRKKRNSKGKHIDCSGYLYAIRAGIVNSIPENTLSDDGLISYLIEKKGYKIEYSDKAYVFVKYPTTFRDWIKQKKRSAGGYNQIKQMYPEIDRMRSFANESFGVFNLFKYPKNLREFVFTFLLILARLYLWMRIFIDINLLKTHKKEFKKVWSRIETTK